MAKILSIDDSKFVHAFIDDCLAGTGHEVVHAYSGEEGIKIAFQDKSIQFDLILLDWEMPGLTGPEVLKKLISQGHKGPISMVTSKNNLEEMAGVLQAGARDYIIKPFTKEILLDKIGQLLATGNS